MTLKRGGVAEDLSFLCSNAEPELQAAQEEDSQIPSWRPRIPAGARATAEDRAREAGGCRALYNADLVIYGTLKEGPIRRSSSPSSTSTAAGLENAQELEGCTGSVRARSCSSVERRQTTKRAAGWRPAPKRSPSS